MPSPEIRMVDDYNAATGTGGRASAILRDVCRSWWILPLLLGAVGFVVVHPFDGQISAAAVAFGNRLSGDARRELEAWQQYGQGLAIALTLVIIWLQDPGQRRRLLDLLLAAGLCEVVAQGAKLLVGRPRPRMEFNDPHTFLWPTGEYPVMHDGKRVLAHAWDSAQNGGGNDLWSMPSSHTLFAVMLGVFLTALYPRLKWVCVFLAALVGSARVIVSAHWPTDVIVGAAVGYAVCSLVVHRCLGVRLVDWVWIRFIDPSAKPAYPLVPR